MTKNEIAQRKRELTARIRELSEERAALCLADKSRDQSKEFRFLILGGQKQVLIRVKPGCNPTTNALNAGITKIMRHYGLPKTACSFVEYNDEDGNALAFDGVNNERTGQLWRVTWELWEWVESGPTLFS
jgi:hypothetical protein